MAQSQNSQAFVPRVRYVSDFTQKACAGADLKKKKAGRPFIFRTEQYMINTAKDGVVVNTYLMFGGVPSPNLHEALEKVGFKLRRRPRGWKDKTGNFVDISTKDNECYAVYYNTEKELTPDQVALICKIYALVNGTRTRKDTFLLATWSEIEDRWGSKDEWLKVCAVDSSSANGSGAASPAPVEEEESGIAAVLSEIDELL